MPVLSGSNAAGRGRGRRWRRKRWRTVLGDAPLADVVVEYLYITLANYADTHTHTHKHTNTQTHTNTHTILILHHHVKNASEASD